MNNYNGDSNGQESFMVILLIGIAGMFYMVSENYWLIAGVWKWIKLIELAPFYLIPESWFQSVTGLPNKQVFEWILDKSATEIARETAIGIDDGFMPWVTWLPSLIMVYWGFNRAFRGGSYNNRYNMEQLLQKVEPLYPHLKPFIDVKPDELPLMYKRNQKNTHDWAMSIAPREFGLMSPPMGLERQAKKKKSLKAPIWDGAKGFDFDLAERSFATQLGESFSGIDHLKSYEKEVFDMFTGRMSVTKDQKLEYFTYIAMHVLKVKGRKPVNESKMGNGMTSLLSYITRDIELKKNPPKKSKQNKPFNPRDYLNEQEMADRVNNDKDKKLQGIFKLIQAEETMGRHAFVRTGLMSLLEAARDSGVLASDQVKWLKQRDRCLWYCMSSVGRKVSFVESAGVFSHWLMEQQVGRPISHPEVGEACTGLWKALKCDVEPE